MTANRKAREKFEILERLEKIIQTERVKGPVSSNTAFTAGMVIGAVGLGVSLITGITALPVTVVAAGVGLMGVAIAAKNKSAFIQQEAEVERLKLLDAPEDLISVAKENKYVVQSLRFQMLVASTVKANRDKILDFEETPVETEAPRDREQPRCGDELTITGILRPGKDSDPRNEDWNGIEQVPCLYVSADKLPVDPGETPEKIGFRIDCKEGVDRSHLSPLECELLEKLETRLKIPQRDLAGSPYLESDQANLGERYTEGRQEIHRTPIEGLGTIGMAKEFVGPPPDDPDPGFRVANIIRIRSATNDSQIFLHPDPYGSVYVHIARSTQERVPSAVLDCSHAALYPPCQPELVEQTRKTREHVRA